MREQKIPSAGVSSAKIVEVVLVAATVGLGADDDPIRRVNSYWSRDGRLLAVADPILDPRLSVSLDD